ncbi:MAG: hypothetical protein EOP04_15885 [Proteobacteria bacterium]|nr:MAG: hypothetical protein EOP04_15885 [Pseudomonadota bacterium]
MSKTVDDIKRKIHEQAELRRQRGELVDGPVQTIVVPSVPPPTVAEVKQAVTSAPSQTPISATPQENVTANNHPVAEEINEDDVFSWDNREGDLYYLTNSLRICLDPRRVARSDVGKLAEALLAIRNDVVVGLARERQGRGWKFYGLGYGSLVNFLKTPQEREGTKREFSTLLDSLIQEGYLFNSSANRKKNVVRQIGPRLYPSRAIGDAAHKLSQLYDFDELEYRFFSYMIAPFHVILRKGNSIKLTLYQAKAFIRWNSPELSTKEQDKASLRLYRRMVWILKFQKTDRLKQGQANLFRLSIQTTREWENLLRRKKDIL